MYCNYFWGIVGGNHEKRVSWYKICFLDREQLEVELHRITEDDNLGEKTIDAMLAPFLNGNCFFLITFLIIF